MELERSLLLILISNSLNFWSLSRDARIFQKKSISSCFSTRSFFPMTITVSPSRILSSGLTHEITLPVLESEKLRASIGTRFHNLYELPAHLGWLTREAQWARRDSNP